MKKILLLFVLFFMGISNSLAVVEYDDDGNVIEYDLGEDEMRITNVEEVDAPDVPGTTNPNSSSDDKEDDFDRPTSSNDPVEYIPRDDDTDKDIMAVTDAELASIEEDDDTMSFVIGGAVLVVVAVGGTLIYLRRKNA